MGGTSAQHVHSAHMTGRNWGVLLQLAIFLPIQTIGHVVALRAHTGNSPKITDHVFDSSTAEQQSPQDNNETAFKKVCTNFLCLNNEGRYGIGH